MSKQFYFLVMFCSICLFQKAIAQDDDKKRPNIIFILTDDQRFDAIGYAGNPYVKTPEMDDLAESGLILIQP